jgi:putative SOS response-associated peptidase YedK
MCFTVNINLTRNQLEKRFGARFTQASLFRPGYYFNAFEKPLLPAIRGEDPESIRLLRWGLIPFWVKDGKAAAEISMKTFNARGETILEKPSFRAAARYRRCIILIRGFYEWQQRDKEKIPHYIYLEGESPVALAGLYEDWTDPGSGEIHETCTIVTTAANSLMEKIHNSKKRMPVMLDPANEKAWIDPGLSPERAFEHLKPIDEKQMRSHTISKLISKRGVEKNVPELVEPFAYDSDRLFPD